MCGLDRLQQMETFVRVCGHAHPPHCEDKSHKTQRQSRPLHEFYVKFLVDKAPEQDMRGFFKWCVNLRLRGGAQVQAVEKMGFLMT